MDNLPSKAGAPVPALRPAEGRLASAGRKVTQLWNAGRAEMAEGLEAAGASVERIHRRVAIVVIALFALLIAGAACRSLGWPDGNYLLIAMLGAGALYALLSPFHIAGVLLVGGGVAAARGMGGARDALLGYARLLAKIFLAFLLPLFLFAMAPGDTSFGTSLRLILLVPVAGLAIWLFGRIAPRAEKIIFVAVPLGAVTLALLNMLIPERTLAAIGVPAWLRASRPQDEELAKLESTIAARRNAERAAQLRVIRAKVERGETLSGDDQKIILAAQQDRVTLTGWAGERYRMVLDEVRRRVTPDAGTPPPLATMSLAGSVAAPASGWSDALPVPATFRVCTRSDAGERSYTTGCHLRSEAADRWFLRKSGKCTPGLIDRVRFRGRGGVQTIHYRLVKLTDSCG